MCVNAIGENIQQRLNGCDYDSDAMLITDDKLLIEAAEKYNENFKVPVCGISSMSKIGQTLAELDHDTSENKIGEIVNLSQKLNSIIWNEIHHGAPGRTRRRGSSPLCQRSITLRYCARAFFTLSSQER